jgi:hypothetical protein
MIAVCAWCQKFMYEKEPFEQKSVTHGICVPCGDRVMAEMSVLSDAATALPPYYYEGCSGQPDPGHRETEFGAGVRQCSEGTSVA